MRVAAVIPHWNRAELLAPLLAQLNLQIRRFDEIIVVDNGSTDGSAEVAEQAGVRVIRLHRNYGFAAAVNRGIAATDADWIAILNNDVTLDPAWLDRLLAVSDAGAVWFATGKILSARDHSILDGTWDEISRGACAMRCGSGLPDGPFWNQRRSIRMTSMTACLIRRQAFIDLGPLDERFESYLEDVDFGLRCAKASLGGIYEPAAVAYHQGSSTWGAWSTDTVRLVSRNQVLLTAKHFRGQPVWPILAGQLLWGLVALRHGCWWAWFQGKLGGWKMAAQIEDETGDSEGFAALIRSSEAEILSRPRGLYWRLYSWLTTTR